jgi:hypothetical protein
MNGFCSRCGDALLPRARFCANCGANLGRDAGTPVLSAHELRDATDEVRAVSAHGDDTTTESPGPATVGGLLDDRVTSLEAPTMPAGVAQGLRQAGNDALGSLKLKVDRWWAQQRDHSSRNAVVFCSLLLVVAITVAWTLGGSGGGGSPSATRPVHSTRPAARRTHKRVTSTTRPGPVSPDPRLQGYVGQLEGILQNSAAGRAQLAGTVRSVQPSCGSPSPAAQQQLTTVIQNRNGLVQELDALGPGPDPTTQTAASLLHQALDASTQADVQYRLWAGALASAPADQCSSDPSAASALAAAHAYDSSATSLKTQFVALFDPLAAQFGLPAWSQADF